jgi:hypothetical protein
MFSYYKYKYNILIDNMFFIMCTYIYNRSFTPRRVLVVQSLRYVKDKMITTNNKICNLLQTWGNFFVLIYLILVWPYQILLLSLSIGLGVTPQTTTLKDEKQVDSNLPYPQQKYKHISTLESTLQGVLFPQPDISLTLSIQR